MYPTTINTVTVSNGGINYSSGSTQVTLSGGGGSGAVAVANISGGVISSILMLSNGMGYTGPPPIGITSGITNTTGFVGGTGYVLANTQITLSGGGGSGAIITPSIAAGIITASAITTAGK